MAMCFYSRQPPLVTSYETPGEMVQVNNNVINSSVSFVVGSSKYPASTQVRRYLRVVGWAAVCSMVVNTLQYGRITTQDSKIVEIMINSVYMYSKINRTEIRGVKAM